MLLAKIGKYSLFVKEMQRYLLQKYSILIDEKGGRNYVCADILGRSVLPQQPRCEGYGFVERHFFAISIDYNEQVFGVERYFSPFLVAGGRAYTSFIVAVNREPFDIENAPADTPEDFSFFPDSQDESVSFDTIGIESSDGVSRTDRDQIDEIDQCIDAIDSQTSDNAPAKGLGGNSIPIGVFTERPIGFSCGLYGGSFVYFVDFVGGCDAGGFVVYLCPQTRVGFSIGYLCTDDTDFQAGADPCKIVFDTNGFHAFLLFWIKKDISEAVLNLLEIILSLQAGMFRPY